MSRNFELITELHEQPKLSPIPIPNPQMQVLSTAAGQKSDASDQILHLIQRVFLVGNAAPRQVVISGLDGQVSSASVCASIGRALSTVTAHSVCLIDGMPGAKSPLAHCLGLDALNPNGRVQINGRLWLADANVLAPEAGCLIGVEELKKRFVALHSEFEYVIIDAPSINTSNHALVLGQAADALILVIDANRTRRIVARKAKETLDAAGVRLLGTVLYDRSFPIPEHLYKRL
jgi:receptor protein-tyrosine kinase